MGSQQRTIDDRRPPHVGEPGSGTRANKTYHVRSCFLVPDQSLSDYPDCTCYGEQPDVLFGGQFFSPPLSRLSEAAEGHQLVVAQASAGILPFPSWACRLGSDLVAASSRSARSF